MSNNQNDQILRYADMFKALSNHHRLKIFLTLISCCPPGTRYACDDDIKRYVGQLAEQVSVAPSTVSHHIKELRNAGLIRVARSGKNIECWVDAEAVSALADLFSCRFLLETPAAGSTQIAENSAGTTVPAGGPDATSCCPSCNSRLQDTSS